MANRNLEDLLASDDELPYSYEEDADLPAYQNDNRFDVIDFPWINSQKVLEHLDHNNSSRLPKPKPNPQQSANAISTKIKNEKEESREKKLLVKGILKKSDIFCVKCIATFSTDTTMLWFIKFLMQKDILTDYHFLKSCLVEEFGNANSSKIVKKEQFIDCEPNNHLQIVVK